MAKDCVVKNHQLDAKLIKFRESFQESVSLSLLRFFGENQKKARRTSALPGIK